MDIMQKLEILTDAAKYDVACTSSGVERAGKKGQLGNTVAAGLCHSFAADGRCISLLKVLMTNVCAFDCKYCASRRSNDVPRAAFTPRELAELTMGFYRRNYIEGLFLSSGVIREPDYAMEQMTAAISLLRNEYRFNGYIHVKAIPGASSEAVTRLGLLADRMSVNIEMPSEASLVKFAPDKPKTGILRPMAFIRDGIEENKEALALYRHARSFVPAGQSTQMIIGATPETDFQILRLTESLYNKFSLKRVFFSAYLPVGNQELLPRTPPQLLREHRLYQADWLLRFYGFKASEIVSEAQPLLDPLLDPKCHWAMGHLEQFPVEINRADYETLLRVPGIGVKSAQRILAARRAARLDFDHLKKLGIVLKRASYFITCGGKRFGGMKMEHDYIYRCLTSSAPRFQMEAAAQLSIFDTSLKVLGEDTQKCLTGEM